jgi:DNA recombination protein RmuC
MSSDLLTIIIVLVAGLSTLYFLLSKKQASQTPDTTLTEWLKSMQASIDENNKQINDRLTKAAIAIGQVSEIGRNMQELQDFLKSPKLRGNIGEEVLKDLISQTFPKNSFNLQYEFRGGQKVDAAIKTDAGILPIDSKFPMENFTKMNKAVSATEKDAYKKEFIRDVKKHIDDIAKKYILPAEGTMDFCLMYIPSEPVYYEVAANPELLDYARRKRVYAVSPTTLYAHLQVILLSFEGKKIETRSREIFALLRALKVDYEKVNDNLGILGKHVGNASAQFNNVLTSFQQIGKKLDTTKELESEVVKEIDPQ